MSLYPLPRDYDSQFHCPEPENMHGVMGRDPNRYEVEASREPVVMPETERSLAWKKRLAEAR